MLFPPNIKVKNSPIKFKSYSKVTKFHYKTKKSSPNVFYFNNLRIFNIKSLPLL